MKEASASAPVIHPKAPETNCLTCLDFLPLQPSASGGEG